MTAIKKKKKKKIKLTPEDIAKLKYRNEVRTIFLRSGFKRIPGVSDKEFTFQSTYKTDFDDVFIYENIIVFIEYTLSKSENLSSHLKPKKIVYDAILGSKNEFLSFFDSKFATFQEIRNSIYSNPQTKVLILYCSKNDVDSSLKNQITTIKYFDYPILKYFQAVTDCIKLSARFELLKFLGLDFKDIGDNILKSTISKKEIEGTLLPESHSNFKNGYKLVSFYIDPDTLLTNSYVLRKDGWRDEGGLYQRMIVKKKLIAIRKYLLTEERVFINNIIVTLPPQTRLKNSDGNTVDPKHLSKTEPVIIEIPDAFNVIGLIDGQHRVFAYHEGGEKDNDIGKLRKKQNLLVTGIIYPKNISTVEKSKFEATLFLEINSNQANAKTELKQAIGLILNPFLSESIAKAVLYRLNVSGPLENKFEKHFYEKDKVKTSSIVSFGLKPIVKLSGNDSFFYLWKNNRKDVLLEKDDENLLKEYIDFCTTQLNIFLGAAKQAIGSNRWTTDASATNKILSTTTINGLIICLRFLIEFKKTATFDQYLKKLSGASTFNFSKYKSSQYGALGRDFYESFFK